MSDFNLAIEVLEGWDASQEQIGKILPPACDSGESIERSGLILSINDALGWAFENPENRTGFMKLKNNNPYFEGRSALEVIASGSLVDLREVSKRIHRFGQI